MLDADLAALYGVSTGNLNKAVTRNVSRFPQDFMFRLTWAEFDHLRSQIGISSSWGGRRYLPRGFTGGSSLFRPAGVRALWDDYLAGRVHWSRPWTVAAFLRWSHDRSVQGV